MQIILEKTETQKKFISTSAFSISYEQETRNKNTTNEATSWFSNYIVSKRIYLKGSGLKMDMHEGQKVLIRTVKSKMQAQ